MIALFLGGRLKFRYLIQLLMILPVELIRIHTFIFMFFFLVKISLGEERLPHTRDRASRRPQKELILDL